MWRFIFSSNLTNYMYLAPASFDPIALVLCPHIYTIKTGLTSCILNINIRFRVQYIPGLYINTSYDHGVGCMVCPTSSWPISKKPSRRNYQRTGTF
jgi:hypothetical protein